MAKYPPKVMKLALKSATSGKRGTEDGGRNATRAPFGNAATGKKKR